MRKQKFYPQTLIQKTIFTLIIMIIYLIGRGLPLYGIDMSAYRDEAVLATEDLLSQTIGGDAYKISLFALGISPYMFSMLLVQIVSACRSSDAKTRTSQKKMSEYTVIITLIWATVQAYMQVPDLIYRVPESELLLAQCVSGLQLVVGAFLILWLATRNAKYGIGGQTILIFVNILDSLVSVLKSVPFEELAIPLAIGIAAMVGTIILENSEYRIPMQRISIHNIYSDKNYIALKLNPIGMMPVMFAVAFFALPQLITRVIMSLNPGSIKAAWYFENMSLYRPLGVVVYILILYFLTILFSFVFINPRDITENLMKSGDSITNLRVGQQTRAYIRKKVLQLSLLSATFMSIAIGIPMVLQLQGYVAQEVMTLPSIMMALAGINCNLYRTYIAVRDYDAYVPFI